MTAQRSDVSELPGSRLEPAVHDELVRRASHLCLRAEPHTEQSPCPAHVSEANRQLFGLVV